MATWEPGIKLDLKQKIHYAGDSIVGVGEQEFDTKIGSLMQKLRGSLRYRPPDKGA